MEYSIFVLSADSTEEFKLEKRFFSHFMFGTKARQEYFFVFLTDVRRRWLAHTQTDDIGKRGWLLGT